MDQRAIDATNGGLLRDHDDYWRMRDDLLAKYPGKWVAVRKGEIVAVGDDPLGIAEQAAAEDGYAYGNLVGQEDEVTMRQRQVSYAYDRSSGRIAPLRGFRNIAPCGRLPCARMTPTGATLRGQSGVSLGHPQC